LPVVKFISTSYNSNQVRRWFVAEAGGGVVGGCGVTDSFCATETAATVLSVCSTRGNNKLQRRALAKCFMIVSPKRLRRRAFASRCFGKALFAGFM